MYEAIERDSRSLGDDMSGERERIELLASDVRIGSDAPERYVSMDNTDYN